jgi:ankyrin repeat protein
MCDDSLPVELFAEVGMHLDLADVFSLSVSCKGAAKGLLERRELVVAWIVACYMRWDACDPLTSALAMVSSVRDGRVHACMDTCSVLEALLPLLRAAGKLSASDAVRALCLASERGYERAVDVLLAGAPLSDLAAPCAEGRAQAQEQAQAQEHARPAEPVTRLEAAYRALQATLSGRVCARLLDWAPEVVSERVHFRSLLHRALEARRAAVALELVVRCRALPPGVLRAAMQDRDDAGYRHTPLSLACDLPDEDETSLAIVRALLDAGAWHSPQVGMWSCKMPLHLAAARGSAGAVRALLDAGAVPAIRDCFGRTPLHDARGAGAARALLEAGADPNCLDGHGHAPLHCARDAGAARALLDAGADPNLAGGGIRHARPLHRAAALEDGHAARDVLGALLQAGADPALRDADEHTALHRARTKAAVEALVAAGARLDARNKHGQLPLHAAISRVGISTDFRHMPPHAEVIEALAKAGADPLARWPDGTTALGMICLRYESDANTTDDVRTSILGMLAHSPALATARRADALDAQGRTPLDLARAAGFKAVEAALLRDPWAKFAGARAGGARTANFGGESAGGSGFSTASP